MGEVGFGTDGTCVSEVFFPQVVGVVSKDVPLTGGCAGFGFDAQEDWDVLVGMEAVCDKKGHDDDVLELGEGVPFCDEGGLFHVGVEDFAEDAEFANFFYFPFCGEGRVVIEVGAVSDDEKA